MSATRFISLWVVLLLLVAGRGHAACQNEGGSPLDCGQETPGRVTSEANTSTTSSASGNPINVTNGNKYQMEIDMAPLPGPLGLELVRHYNSRQASMGHAGYGWRFSYETELFVQNDLLQVAQADGSLIIFNRNRQDPTVCTPNDPARGTIRVERTARGEEYVWIWGNGRSLSFDRHGRLVQITTPEGHISTLTRGPKGELMKVTDPQGRSMTFEYARKKSAGFKGVIAVNTPVGRYQYLHDDDRQSAGFGNLLRVQYPEEKTGMHGQHAAETEAFRQAHHIERQYHYGENITVPENRGSLPEARQIAHALTGITVHWQDTQPGAQTDKQPKPQQRRINTWAYNAQGRAIFSVLGPYDPTAKTAGPGQVALRFSNPHQYTDQDTPPHSVSRPHTHQGHAAHEHASQVNTTLLTNSLGQTTTIKHTVIAGQFRLLEVLGPGCDSCPEPNMRYRYDALARLVDSLRLKPDGTPLHLTRRTYDKASRVTAIEEIAYRQGKAQPARLIRRFVYPVLSEEAALAMGRLKGYAANKQTQYTWAVYRQPVLIAEPSVVPGQEHQWHITYNPYGQPTQITETGYRPALINKAGAEATQISRTITYRYTEINNRSLLAQIDGPLPNGRTHSPKDSDITQYQYDKLGQYLIQITAPGNIKTQLAYDRKGNPATGGTGRVVEMISHNDMAIHYNYNQAGKVVSTERYPASFNLAAAKEAGLWQSSSMQYDLFGNTTMIKRADGQTVYMQYGKDGKLTQLSDALGNRVEWKDWGKGQHKQDETLTTQQWFTADAPDTVARAWYFWRDNQNRLTQRLSPDGGLDTWDYSNRDTSATPQNHWVQHIDPLNRMTLSAVSNQGYAQVRMTPDGFMDAHFSAMADQAPVQTESKQSKTQPVQIQDDFGRVIQFSSPQHGTHIADYNAANRISKIQQPDGTQIDYTYDVAGRLLTKTATHPQPKQTASVHYAYNLFGLSQIKDNNQTLSYSQDLLGREIDKATTLKLKNGLTKTYHIHTRYTVDGKVKAKQLINGDWLVFTLNGTTGVTQAMTLHKTIWPSLTNQLADWLNMPDLPLQIATTEKVVTDIKAHPFNGITHIAHGNGISDDYGFDIAGRLITVSHGKAAQHSHQQQPFVNATYKYDAGRRLISERISTAEFKANVREYAYTGWNTFATPPQSGFIKAVVSTTPTHSKDAGIANARLSQADMAETTLDQAGRTTTDQHYRYQYDAWGKLSSVQTKTNNATIAIYQSNALGERTMASYPTAERQQTRYYLYDKQQRIAELDEAGNVVQQYLYVNQTPVAVINTPATASDTHQAGIIAIHTDRRHAPIAATDEQGKVIWQAEYDAWGKVIPASLREERVNPNQSNQANTFNLAMRLPGQWQDQATGLYYNYQRDYNPETGRYLTPDPLGFPDGTDPYAYVNNDPLNKLDPLGLYQSDIHYYMTFFLAVAAGVPAEDARIIALAAQYVDENPATRPLDPDNPLDNVNNQQAIDRLLSYHFTATPSAIGEDGLTHSKFIYLTGNSGMRIIAEAPKNPAYANIPENQQLLRLYDAVSLAKCNALGRNAELQFFGEYLHAFQDTFGHRDANNIPIDVQNGIGHGSYDSNPDYTYNHVALFDFLPLPGHVNWNNNEARTLQMEKEVFAKMKQFATGQDVISAEKISEKAFYEFLAEFNDLEEDEDNKKYVKGDVKSGEAPSGEKIKKLQDQLDKWFGTGVIDITKFDNAAFDEKLAANNRNSFLCVNGKPLDQKVYEGTILPTSCN